ncbi:NADP-dependent oxidoreductase [Actinoallomurus acanthiterrae]
MGETMRALVATTYGGPEVLRIAEVARPEPGAGEVLVRVAAAGTNPADSVARAGLIRDWFGEGPYVWGWDVSGVVTAVGPGVVRFAPGDQVFGMPRFPQPAGGYAEYVRAPAHELAAKPDGMDHMAAAALPMCGLTALQTLDLAGVSPRQRVLVNGAAGGVGHLAVQLAKTHGAQVIGVAREVNHPFLKSIGADDAVDYTTTRVADAFDDLDVVIDCVGDDGLVATLRRGGVFVCVPGAAQGRGPLEEAAEASGVRVVRHVVHPDGAGLARLAQLVESGSLSVAVSRTLPLEEGAVAHELLDTGHTRGKIVLVVRDEEAGDRA